MRSKAAIESGLRNKGFRQLNTHHRFFVYYTVAGKKSNLRTRTSHGAKDIGRHLISQMAKQCGLNTADFLKLVDCPMSQTDYEAKVSSRL